MYCFYYGAGGLITICATIYCFDNELQEQLLTAYGFLCLYCLYKVSIIYDTIYFGLGYYDFNLHILTLLKMLNMMWLSRSVFIFLTFTLTLGNDGTGSLGQKVCLHGTLYGTNEYGFSPCHWKRWWTQWLIYACDATGNLKIILNIYYKIWREKNSFLQHQSSQRLFKL